MTTNMLKAISCALVLSALIAPMPSWASSGSLSLSAPTETQVGQRFSVAIRARSGGAVVNAIGADLIYPSDLIKAISIIEPSVISLGIVKDVSRPGAVSIQGGILPAQTLAAAAVGTVVFEAIAPGAAKISVAGSSAMYLDDGKGTDILTDRGTAAIEVKKAEKPAVGQEPATNANIPVIKPPAPGTNEPSEPPVIIPPEGGLPTNEPILQPAVPVVEVPSAECALPWGTPIIIGAAAGAAVILLYLVLIDVLRRRRK